MNNICTVESKTNIQGWNIIYIKPISSRNMISSNEKTIIESRPSTTIELTRKVEDLTKNPPIQDKTSRKHTFRGLSLPEFDKDLDQLLLEVSKEYNQ